MKNQKNGKQIESGLEVAKKKRNIRISAESHVCLSIGIILAIHAGYGFLLGKPVYSKGILMSEYAVFFEFLFGVLMSFASFRALLRIRKQAKKNAQLKIGPYDCPYTDEEVAEAERTMDALYLREHGELPDKARADDTKTL